MAPHEAQASSLSAQEIDAWRDAAPVLRRTLIAWTHRAARSARALVHPFTGRAADPDPCPPPRRAHAAVFVLPHHPVARQPVRIVAVAWRRHQMAGLDVKLGGRNLPVVVRSGAGAPPYTLIAQARAPRAGRLSVRVLGARSTLSTVACTKAYVTREAAPPPSQAPYAEVWPVTRQWDQWTEALFSAWVAHLFYVPAGGRGGWRPLHQLTRDPQRNLLYDALGWNEDAPDQIVLFPDCGDLPYFLRAYFSFKLGLPFAYQRCTRGDALVGPRCPVSRDNLSRRYVITDSPIDRFNHFVRESIGWGVHSGTARTLPTDQGSDFYPISLTARALRPGRIFVDPAGHVHVVSQVRSATRRRMGVLFGVDAHPDRTISRKRFSQGTFVFDARVPTGGFKAFRPLVFEKGRIRRLSNAAIADLPAHRDFSAQQAHFSSNAAFYGTVQRALTPYPMDPRQVLRQKILALHEAALERVGAVEMGRLYMERTGWRPIPMPRGPSIFETVGPWETYSTPARDLRLLMAIHDVLEFPRQVTRAPQLFRFPTGWSIRRVRRALRAERDRLTQTLTLRYHRSDGSEWRLTLADLIRRRRALTMGYHPSDCPEVRWGAPPKSPESRTCIMHAPRPVRTRMGRYQVWFQLLKRPTLRG